MANLLEKHYGEKQAGALQRISTAADNKEKKPWRQARRSEPEAPSLAYLFGNAIAHPSTPFNEPFPYTIRASGEPHTDKGKGGPASRFLRHLREVKGI